MAAAINKGGVKRDNDKAAHFLAVFGVRDYSKETTTATGSPAKETSAPSCSSVSFLPPRDTAIDFAESSVPPGQPNLDELDAGDECGAGDDGLGPAARKELVQDPPDLPDEPRCGLWANDQLHHRQPDTVVSNGGSRFDLNLGAWIQHTADAVANDKGLAAFEKDIGKKLTEDTVVEAMEMMVKIASEHKKIGHVMDEANLTPVERKEYARLQAAAKAGSFDTQSYLGNQFRKFLKSHPEKDEQYKCQNRAEAAEFRASWLKDSLEKWKEQRRETNSWSRVDTTQGHYMNFARLVKFWGGWKADEAIKGSVAAAQKCLCMGPPWLHVHPQAGFVEFLILDFGFTENFKQAWEQFRTEYSAGDNVAAKQLEDPAAEVPEKNAKKNKGESAAEAEPKEKKQRGSKTEEKPAQKDKVTKSTLIIEKLDNAGLWREANKLKSKFQQASSAFMEVSDKIAHDPAWDWHQGKNEARLTEAHTAIKNVLTDFHKRYMMSADVGSMKKSYSTATCEIELRSFLRTADLVDNLALVALQIFNSQKALTTA
jgi:hypothetical protein